MSKLAVQSTSMTYGRTRTAVDDTITRMTVPRSVNDLRHPASGVVVVVAHEASLPLHPKQLEQAACRARVLRRDHVGCP